MKYCDITLERVLMHTLDVQRHSSMFKIITIRYEIRLTFSVSHLRGAEFRSITEAAVRRCTLKQVLGEISHSSWENTCDGVSFFLINLQIVGLQLY